MATIKRRVPLSRLTPEQRNDRYYKDPRWEQAKELARMSSFEECNRIVTTIMQNYGKIYGKD